MRAETFLLAIIAQWWAGVSVRARLREAIDQAVGTAQNCRMKRNAKTVSGAGQSAGVGGVSVGDGGGVQRGSINLTGGEGQAATWRHVDTLEPWGKNPRKNDAAAKELAKTLKRLGFGSACLTWSDPETGKDILIAGNTRLKATRILIDDYAKGERDVGGVPWNQDAIRLAETGLIPCRSRNDLSREDAILMALADNRMGEMAKWDDEKLGELMLGLPKSDLMTVGWERSEIDALVTGGADASVDAEPKLELSDQLREQWGTELGQLWRCGKHLILCGDSTDLECVRRIMGEDRADLVFTDPPYGVSIGKKNRMLQEHNKHVRTTSDIVDDSVSADELRPRLVATFENIVSGVMSESCTVFVTFPLSGELGPMIFSVLSDAKIPVRHVLFWKKNSPTFSLGRLDYNCQHEEILLTWGKRHKRPMRGDHRTTVWEIDKPKSSEEHPTIKPVELVVNALMNNSDVGDIVFDAYSGSGTTMIACEQTCRKARVIELEPRYVAVALQRYKDATGNTPELVP